MSTKSVNTHEHPAYKGLHAPACSLYDFMEAINRASIEWVQENIHPHVQRKPNDNNAAYLRRMALWAQSTNTFPANAEMTHPETKP